MALEVADASAGSLCVYDVLEVADPPSKVSTAPTSTAAVGSRQEVVATPIISRPPKPTTVGPLVSLTGVEEGEISSLPSFSSGSRSRSSHDSSPLTLQELLLLLSHVPPSVADEFDALRRQLRSSAFST